MPGSDDVRYYPVLVRILRLLGGLSLVTYRAGIVSRKGAWVTDRRAIDRFVMEYKGPEDSAGAPNAEALDMYRARMIEYLEQKCLKVKRYNNHDFEPMVEIEIDLRKVMPITVP